MPSCLPRLFLVSCPNFAASFDWKSICGWPACAERGLRALQLVAAVDDRARILIRAVGIVGVLLVGIGARADLRRDDLELEHGRFFEQPFRLVGVLDRGQLDEQAVRADLRDHGLGDAEAVDAVLHDGLDLVLHVGGDRRELLWSAATRAARVRRPAGRDRGGFSAGSGGSPRCTALPRPGGGPLEAAS